MPTLALRNRLHTSRWLLLAMLVLLHGVVLVGIESIWSSPLLLAHLGLFLIWQPLWRGESKVGRSALLFIGLAAAVVVFWLNWWVVAFWIIGLFGLVGGRVFAFRDRWVRLLYLLVVTYLLALLLLRVVPNLFAVHPPIEIGRVLMLYVLPVLLVVMALLPAKSEQVAGAQTVDFIYSLLLFMLLALVVLGSLAFMMLAHLNYLEALLRTLLLAGSVLLMLGMLWNPHFGFNGLQVMFSRYLLNVGTPFEGWLTRLAEAAQNETSAASYLRRAVALLADLPWLSGLSWQSPDGSGQLGRISAHEVRVQKGDLHLVIYARQSLGTTVSLHIHLLAQMVVYFYQTKQREQSLRDITRLQTVYETGSRLTHDLKNMLQSLLSITTIAQSNEGKAQQLLRQQLPLLAQRIELTLGKLQQPQTGNGVPEQDLGVWWDALQLRNQPYEIQWHAPDKLPNQNIPATLFDCVLDNLLDNALRKRETGCDIAIAVEIQIEPLRITVCDSGEPIPESIAANLLRGIVVSGDHLGIGLYQAARWAEQLGFRLTLACNQRGKVCFELAV